MTSGYVYIWFDITVFYDSVSFELNYATSVFEQLYLLIKSFEIFNFHAILQKKISPGTHSKEVRRVLLHTIYIFCKVMSIMIVYAMTF
ncbi:hypothetical protein JN09_000708 [Acholeplasma morum]|nr:hypothetical protein [Paracholeplasma morum]